MAVSLLSKKEIRSLGGGGTRSIIRLMHSISIDLNMAHTLVQNLAMKTNLNRANARKNTVL